MCHKKSCRATHAQMLTLQMGELPEDEGEQGSGRGGCDGEEDEPGLLAALDRLLHQLLHPYLRSGGRCHSSDKYT